MGESVEKRRPIVAGKENRLDWKTAASFSI